MANNNNDDLVAGVIGFGVLAAAGFVGYKVIRAIADRGQEPTPQPVPAMASSDTPRYESSSIYDDSDDYYPDYEGEDLEDAEND
jgi:hypothetical protein